jgi:hypothetical protein
VASTDPYSKLTAVAVTSDEETEVQSGDGKLTLDPCWDLKWDKPFPN